MANFKERENSVQSLYLPGQQGPSPCMRLFSCSVCPRVDSPPSPSDTPACWGSSSPRPLGRGCYLASLCSDRAQTVLWSDWG